MKITLGQLREIVRKAISGSQPEESYTEELLDDPAFKKKSVLVRDDAKKKIASWAKDMKLSTK
jgi:hypothetical protein